MSTRVLGKTKFFNAQRGWGFIAGSDGKEYFLHYSELEGRGTKENPKKLDPNEEVEFTPADGKRGPLAKDVKRVQKEK